MMLLNTEKIVKRIIAFLIPKTLGLVSVNNKILIHVKIERGPFLF